MAKRTCSIASCEGTAVSRGWCNRHYSSWKRYGDPLVAGRVQAEKCWRAEQNFRRRLSELGATLIEPEWLGTQKRHHAVCVNGHDCWPRPSNVHSGWGICVKCSSRDPGRAERRFFKRLAELGATPLEPYKGAHIGVKIRCAAGHVRSPIPNSVAKGFGVCGVCARNDPGQACRNFHERVTELGGAVLEPGWLGRKAPHRVRCSEGHVGSATPNYVSQGGGICRTCSNRSWDVFYVVVSAAENRVKFGVTSGDSRWRLAEHARAGYRDVVRNLCNLAGGVALEMERNTRGALRDAGMVPVRGREYFDISALSLILDLVDNYSVESVAS